MFTWKKPRKLPVLSMPKDSTPKAQSAPVSRTTTNGARSQSLVELALALPLLLIILVGVLDLGRVYFAYMTVVNASREGARYGATKPTDTTGITTRANNEASGSGITLASVTPSCPNGCSAGNPIRVTVTADFQLITTYLFGGGTIPLSAFTEFVIFQ